MKLDDFLSSGKVFGSLSVNHIFETRQGCGQETSRIVAFFFFFFKQRESLNSTSYSMTVGSSLKTVHFLYLI